MKKKKRFVLVDSNSLVHRAYHAYPSHLSTSKGEQVNAIYGFSTILIKIIEDLKPSYLICVFDVAGPTFRHEFYKEYKATRKPLEKELVNQIPRVKEVIQAFDIPILEIKGYEADDIIGTLENDKKMKNFEKVIVTGDQDIFQLVDGDTKIFMSGRNFSQSKLFGVKDVEEKIGIKPSQVIDYKALCGDPSDNIPGVKGIGKSGAVKLLREFLSLEGIYSNLEKIETRYRNRLEEGKESAILSKKLATIKRDLKLDYKIKDCAWGAFDAGKVRGKFQEFEFRSLLKKLDKIQKEDSVPVKTEKVKSIDCVSVDTKEKFVSLLKDLKGQKLFALIAQEVRGSSIDSQAALISVSWDGKRTYCIKRDLIKPQEEFTKEGKEFKKILEDKAVHKVGADIKASMHSLYNLGIDLSGIYFDVQIAAYLIQAGMGSVYLKDLTFSYLGEVTDEDKEAQMDILNSSYVSNAAALIWRLYKLLDKKLKGLSKKGKWNLETLFHKVEMPLVKTLFQMERQGILADKEFLKKFADKLDKEIAKIQKKIYDCTGHEFNINSPKQVSEILFEELDLPKSRRTKGGSFSTGVSTLLDLKGVHPVIELILEFRELSKLRSTYTTTLIDSINSKTGRIHTTYNQVVTTTGRLSSTDPNLQNIPISTDLGRSIRKAFIADKNSTLVSFDYSQQELRILAHLAKEKNLIKAFEEKVDVHRLTASKLFNKEIGKVSKRERSIGKTINFAVMYGMGPHGLSQSLKVTFDEANDFIEKYFEEYSYVHEFFDKFIQTAKSEGYAVTMFGRRRQAKGLESTNFAQKRAALRELINFPIQGSAADMMKLAMIKVQKLVNKEFKNDARMILQIHDELVFEFSKKGNITAFKNRVERMMENIYPLEVPLKVDVYEGKNLEEVH